MPTYTLITTIGRSGIILLNLVFETFWCGGRPGNILPLVPVLRRGEASLLFFGLQVLVAGYGCGRPHSSAAWFLSTTLFTLVCTLLVGAPEFAPMQVAVLMLP